MSLKPFECKNCGSPLTQCGDGSFVCLHCGTAYKDQDDIININTTNNIRNENHFYGTTVLTQAQKDNVEGYFFRLTEEYKQGNFIDAKKFLDRVLEIDPLNPDANIVKAYFNEFFRASKVRISLGKLLDFIKKHIITSITQSAKVSLWIFAFEIQKYVLKFRDRNFQTSKWIVQQIKAYRPNSQTDDNLRIFSEILELYIEGPKLLKKKYRKKGGCLIGCLKGFLIFLACLAGIFVVLMVVLGIILP
jgi:tetratricopeptide (TPR) repeat protein